jgi:hypothetical protein
MKRRNLILALRRDVAAWSAAGRGQLSTLPVIGFLSSITDESAHLCCSSAAGWEKAA